MEQDKQQEQVEAWPPAPQGQASAGAGPVGGGQPPRVTSAKHLLDARLVGVFLLVLFSGFTLWFRADLLAGRSVPEKAVVVLPVGLLAGLAYLVEPRILLAGYKDAPPQPAVFKVLGYVVGVVGLGIGLYIRYTFFK